MFSFSFAPFNLDNDSIDPISHATRKPILLRQAVDEWAKSYTLNTSVYLNQEPHQFIHDTPH
jgi:hypothetical protein